jgi:hypothetical protein
VAVGSGCPRPTSDFDEPHPGIATNTCKPLIGASPASILAGRNVRMYLADSRMTRCCGLQQLVCGIVHTARLQTDGDSAVV